MHNAEPPARNPQIDNEPGDANTAALARFGAGLAILIMVAGGLMLLLFGALAGREAQRSPQPPPLASQRPAQPPEPRLQASPKADLKEMREAEEKLLTNYGWVDREKGIARIPIEKAMEIVVAEGNKK
jgi:hypothetical protein